MTKTRSRSSSPHRDKDPAAGPDQDTAQSPQRQPSELAAQAVPGAPVPPGLVIPPPYKVNHDGVWLGMERGDGSLEYRPVLNRPLIPVATIEPGDGITGEVRVVFVFVDNTGTWRVGVVPQRIVANHNTVLQLSGYGLPVTSLNAKAVVRYLTDVMTANLAPRGAGMNRCRGVHSFGWLHGQAGTPEQFAVGDRSVTARGDEAIWVPNSQAVQIPDGLVLDADERDQWVPQIVSAVQCRGTVVDWAAALDGVQQYPRLVLALYAAFVPPLLELLGLPNFIIEWVHDTSRGKTTALRVAASVWGVPDTLAAGHRAGYILSGDGTANALEGAAAMLNDMPLIVDDIHRMDPDRLVRSVYMLAQGAGKARAAPWGMARTRTFRTVALLSSEYSVLSHAKLGGLSARVISIRGLPMDRQGEAERQLAERLRADLMNHYGVAGPELVRYLLASGAARQPESLLQEAAGFKQVFLDAFSKAEGLPQTSRHADYLAAILLAARLAHKCLPLPWSEQAAVQAVSRAFRDVEEAVEGHDMATRALRYWQSVLAEYSREAGEEPVEISDRYGRHVVGSMSPGRHVAILPHYFDEEMRRQGFDPEVVLQVWKDRGWIFTATERGRQIVKPPWYFRGGTHRMVVLRWPAFVSETEAVGAAVADTG